MIINLRAGRTFAILAAAACVAAVPASADPESGKPKNAAQESGAKQKRYCVERPSTGTMLPQKKVCMTREQWIEKTGSDPAERR